MVIIDDIGVCVANRRVTMRMAMWFWSFPALVLMVVMNIMGVFVFVKFRWMFVNQVGLVLLWPYLGRQGSKQQDSRAQQQCSSFHA